MKTHNLFTSSGRMALCGASLWIAAGSASATPLAAWKADAYTSGNWTSSTGGITATVAGSPTLTPNQFGSHPGVTLDGNDYFVIDTASNPLANASAITLVAVFQPTQAGPTHASWWGSSGLIGMEQSGIVRDWGLGWNGNRVGAGSGAPDRGIYSTFHDASHSIVAVYTWNSSGRQRLFINGVKVADDFTPALATRNAGAIALGAMTSNGGVPFIGHLAELQLFNTDESANVAGISEVLADDYFGSVSVQASRLTTTGGEIVLVDGAGSARETNSSGTFTFSINGTATPVVASKSGRFTTLKFAGTYPPNVLAPFTLDIPLADGGTRSLTGNVTAGRLPTQLPGLAGAVNSWGIREYPVASNNDLAAALTFLATEPTTFTEEVSPVFNRVENNGDAAYAPGNFNNKLPILTDTAVDNNFVVIGRTQVTVPAAGDYTFSVHSDDGFAMRISSPTGTGRFLSSGGLGAIDPNDDQTIYRDGGNADSTTRGAYHFDAAGTYDITYLGWDGGGTGFYEVAWAPGIYCEDRQTNQWTLVGNPAAVTVPYRDRFIPSLPGPAGTPGNFGVRSYLLAGTVTGIGYGNAYLRDTVRAPGDGITFDAQVPYLNARDTQDGPSHFVPGEMSFPGDTPASDDNVITTAHGRINITTAGAYTFWFQGDDGFMLRIKGTNGRPNPSFRWATQGGSNAAGAFQMSHPNELFYDANGNPDTRGIIDLAVGTYDLELMHVELTGGFAYELVAAPGAWPHQTTPPDGFQLVGLVSPTNSVIIPGIAEPGWTVQSAPSNAAFAISIAGAEARIDATINGPNPPADSTKLYDVLDFNDPQDGAQGSFTPTNPWPLNTPAADNNYSMRATGILNITEAGDYHLGFQGDDGGYLYIYGHNGTSDPVIDRIVSSKEPAAAIIGQSPGSTVNNAIRVDTTTGDSRTLISVHLEVGQYRLQTLVFEGLSGSWWEVIGSKAADISFAGHQLLRKGPGSTVSFPSGLPLLDQPPLVLHNGPLDISGFVITGSPIAGVNFSFSSTEAVIYTVQASIDLTHWIDVGPGVVGTGATTPVSIDLSGYDLLKNQPKLFFRVVGPAAP